MMVSATEPKVWSQSGGKQKETHARERKADQEQDWLSLVVVVGGGLGNEEEEGGRLCVVGALDDFTRVWAQRHNMRQKKRKNRRKATVPDWADARAPKKATEQQHGWGMIARRR